MRTVLLLGSDEMGRGDRSLGQKILGTFLRKAVALKDLTAVLMINRGVKLATRDSPVLTELTMLHENGADIVACGTCVDHFGLREQIAVGEIGSMDQAIAEMDAADKVITL